MNTVQRNARIVGNNSKSYNEKHPTNVVSLRPIRDAIRALFKTHPVKQFGVHVAIISHYVADPKHVKLLREVGSRVPKQDIMSGMQQFMAGVRAS